MLTLTRKIGESIMIGDDIEITVSAIRGDKMVQLSIEAPRDVQVWRREVYEARNRGEAETGRGNLHPPVRPAGERLDKIRELVRGLAQSGAGAGAEDVAEIYRLACA